MFMRRFNWAVMVIGLSVGSAWAQSRALSPLLSGPEGTLLSGELQDDRIGQRPIAQEDKDLRKGRELKQGEAVVAVRPLVPAAESSSRVRARALLQEDRDRVKREAVLVEQAASQ